MLLLTFQNKLGDKHDYFTPDTTLTDSKYQCQPPAKQIDFLIHKTLTYFNNATSVTRPSSTSQPFYNYILYNSNWNLKIMFKNHHMAKGRQDTAVCFQMIEQWEKENVFFFL